MYEIDLLPVGDASRSGDAIAMRFQTPAMLRPAVVVIDGGYQDDGPALAQHIKTYYGTDHIDLVVSTHPDADHVNGLITLLDEVTVGELMMHLPWKHSTEGIAKAAEARTEVKTYGSAAGKFAKSMSAAVDLETKARALGIPITEPFAGETRFAGALTVVGPNVQFYESLLPDFRKGKAARAGMTESAFAAVTKALSGVIAKVLETLHIETLTDAGVTSAENDSSAVIHIAVDNRRLLLTGDAGIPALTWAADYMDARGLNTQPINLMQVPHHGSKRNVGPTILDRLLGEPNTQIDQLQAVVSAATGDAKHPAKRVSNAFVRRNAHIVTTKDGTVCWASTPRPGWRSLPSLPLYGDVSSDDAD